jgi:hypothetical protein
MARREGGSERKSGRTSSRNKRSQSGRSSSGRSSSGRSPSGKLPETSSEKIPIYFWALLGGALLAIIIFAFALVSRTQSSTVKGPDPNEIAKRAKDLCREGEKHIRQWRHASSPSDALAAWKKAKQSLKESLDKYESLMQDRRVADKEFNLKPGYEWIESEMVRVNQLYHDVVKDAPVDQE